MPGPSGFVGNFDNKRRIDLDATDRDSGAKVSEMLVICFKQPGENAMMHRLRVVRGNSRVLSRKTDFRCEISGVGLCL